MNQVQYINPPGLAPAYSYTNVVVVQGSVKTVYVGGQDAVNEKGEVVGIGDLSEQTRQVLNNLEVALAAGGATLEHVVKWNLHVVQGHDFRLGFRVFQDRWGNRPNLPTITIAI